jgi:hypothetical protein
MGLTHILDEDSIIGVVLVDPARANPTEEKLTAGFQYSVAEKILIMGDAGMDYAGAVSKDYIWSGAVQLNVFADFFLRAGLFYDNINKFKGNGWGIGWIGPKLGVEFAQKFSEQIAKNGYVYEGETLVDTTLSALLKF